MTWRPIVGRSFSAPEFKEFRKKSQEHPIEAVGKELRGLMAWVKSHDDDYVEGSAAR